MLEICGRWARVSHIPFVSPLFQFFLVTDSLTVAAAAPAMPRPLNEAQRELHECRVCRRQLRSEGIESKADFRRWARTHHPDKGGSVRHFQHVAHCVDLVFRDRCVGDGWDVLVPEMQGVLEGWFAARAALTVVSSATLPFAIDLWPYMRGASPRRQPTGASHSPPRRAGFGVGYRVRCPGIAVLGRKLPICEELECVVGTTYQGDSLDVGSVSGIWRTSLPNAKLFCSVMPHFRLLGGDADPQPRPPRPAPSRPAGPQGDGAFASGGSGRPGLAMPAGPNPIPREASDAPGASDTGADWAVGPSVTVGARIQAGPAHVSVGLRAGAVLAALARLAGLGGAGWEPGGGGGWGDGGKGSDPLRLEGVWGGLARAAVLGVGLEFARGGTGEVGVAGRPRGMSVLGCGMDFRGSEDFEELEGGKYGITVIGKRGDPLGRAAAEPEGVREGAHGVGEPDSGAAGASRESPPLVRDGGLRSLLRRVPGVGPSAAGLGQGRARPREAVPQGHHNALGLLSGAVWGRAASEGVRGAVESARAAAERLRGAGQGLARWVQAVAQSRPGVREQGAVGTAIGADGGGGGVTRVAQAKDRMSQGASRSAAQRGASKRREGWPGHAHGDRLAGSRSRGESRGESRSESKARGPGSAASEGPGNPLGRFGDFRVPNIDDLMGTFSMGGQDGSGTRVPHVVLGRQGVAAAVAGGGRMCP